MLDSYILQVSDCRNISDAIRAFHKDTGSWPYWTSATANLESRVDFIFGNGDSSETRRDAGGPYTSN